MQMDPESLERLAMITRDRLRLRVPGYFVAYNVCDAATKLAIDQAYQTHGDLCIESALGARNKYALSAARGVIFLARDDDGDLRSIPWARSEKPNPIEMHRTLKSDFVSASRQLALGTVPTTSIPYPDALSGHWLRGPKAQVFSCPCYTNVSDQHIYAVHTSTHMLPERPKTGVLLRQYGQNLLFWQDGSIENLPNQ